MKDYIRSVDGRWGTCYYLGKDEYVGKSIHNYGEYNPDETEKILELAHEARIGNDGGVKNNDGWCLDIGANFGVMAQALSCYQGDCKPHKVIAFEPQPGVFEVLELNHKGLNYNIGLGDEAGTAKMPKVHYSEKNNFGGMAIGYGSLLGTIDVKVETLDSLELENVYFMKIDVEGYEEKVLRGGAKTILRDKPIMYIEDDRAEKSKDLRAFITGLGYSIEEHKPLLYRPNNYFNKKVNVWDKVYASHNIICRPL